MTSKGGSESLRSQSVSRAIAPALLGTQVHHSDKPISEHFFKLVDNHVRLKANCIDRLD